MRLTDKKQRIILAVVAACSVLLIIGTALIISQSAKNKSKPTDAQNNITASNADDNFDPENTELHTESGDKVDAEKLKNKKGEANGIDVSKWQGKIDWSKVKADGIDFAMIRIGYRGENGQLYKDPAADYNLQQAEKAGILTGVYFFSTAVNKQEAIEEAEWTLQAIAGYSISYPVVYDCEGFKSLSSRMNSLTAGERTENVLAFLNKVKKAGYEAMFYGARNELLNPIFWDMSKIEQKYPVWVAQYSTPTYPEVEHPEYSGQFDMWQYTNCGKVSGVTGNCDINVSYFTRKKAAPKSPSSRPETAKPPKSEDKIYTAVSEQVTAKELVNLRDMASTKGNIVAELKNGTFLTRIATGTNGWSKLEYGGKVVYAITSYLTTDTSYTPPANQDGDIVIGQSFSTASDSVTAKEVVNLRDKPSTDGNIVAELKNGTFIPRTAIGANGWSRLNYNGRVVYAVTSYLTTDAGYIPPKLPEVDEVNGQTFKPASGRVTAKHETNLRSAPVGGDGSTIIYTLKNGEYAELKAKGDMGWWRLEYNGQTVYAVASYLTE